MSHDTAMDMDMDMNMDMDMDMDMDNGCRDEDTVIRNESSRQPKVKSEDGDGTAVEQRWKAAQPLFCCRSEQRLAVVAGGTVRYVGIRDSTVQYSTRCLTKKHHPREWKHNDNDIYIYRQQQKRKQVHKKNWNNVVEKENKAKI